MTTRRFSGSASDAHEIRRIALATGQPADGSAAEGAYREHVQRQGALVVAVDESGVVVGYSGAVPVGGSSLLTDLFVDPSRHGEGFGRELLEAVWPEERSSEPRFTFSSQHHHALSLYLRAGLAPLWPLLYLSGPGDGNLGGASGLTVERVAPAVAAVHEHELTGVDRAADFEYLGRGEALGGLVVVDGSTVVATGLARPGRLEHMACSDVEVAAPAMISALAELTARGASEVRVCLPGPHPAVPQLIDRGFRLTDFDLYMASSSDLLRPTTALSPAFA